MDIIVVGCGKIGLTIISTLVSEGHDVTAIDIDPAVITEITNVYDIMGVCGNCTDYEILQEAGADKTELFVAVTESDEMNILGCLMAKKLGASHTIARVRSKGYNESALEFLHTELDISMCINPELMAAKEIYNVLKLPSAANVEKFSARGFEMIELRLKSDSPLDGMKLMDFRKTYQTNVLICIVQRNNEVFIPDGNFVLKSGDRLAITSSQSEIQKLLRETGMMQKSARSVMLLGGSRTAYYLARQLTATGNSVKIIEKNRELCDQLCEDLPKATIINGDGAQHELLVEEGLLSADAFAALTETDEENILVSIFASSQSVPKVITRVSREELAEMAEKLGLECIVSAQKIIANVISQYARALENSMGSKIETLYKLMDGKAEALEFHVGADSPVIGIELKELVIKHDILIAGIFRGRKTIIPSGNDMISAGDRVIVVAKDHKLQDISDIIVKGAVRSRESQNEPQYARENHTAGSGASPASADNVDNIQ